jgi:hypothetical protein
MGAGMRLVVMMLWAVFGWPVALLASFRARRRLHGHHDRLDTLTIERVA